MKCKLHNENLAKATYSHMCASMTFIRAIMFLGQIDSQFLFNII